MGKRTSNEVLNVIQGNESQVTWYLNSKKDKVYRFGQLFLGNTTVDELMMRLMGAMEIFTAQQQEDIKDEVRFNNN